MGRSPQDYLDLLIGLTPRGRAWSKNPDSFLNQIISGFAPELSRLEERAYILLKESRSDSVEELLEDYEEEYAISPEDLDTDEQRGEVIHAKVTSKASMLEDYYIGIAQSLGYTVYIYSWVPFWSGRSFALSFIGNQSNIFVFTVYADTLFDAGGFTLGFDTGFSVRAGDTDIDPVCNMTRNLDKLIQELDKIKPGHAFALYDFYGRDFSRGFSWGFECLPYYDGIIPFPGFTLGFSTGFAAMAEYDGSYLTGGFDQGFDMGIDVCHGGSFTHDGFEDGFSKPR